MVAGNETSGVYTRLARFERHTRGIEFNCWIEGGWKFLKVCIRNTLSHIWASRAFIAFLRWLDTFKFCLSFCICWIWAFLAAISLDRVLVIKDLNKACLTIPTGSIFISFIEWNYILIDQATICSIIDNIISVRSDKVFKWAQVW